ncbi:MAG TPA: pyridoxamine 5'-phosphate oxidase family protein [Planktothrix sp.]
MAKFYQQLDETLREFILAQHIFFHASAPLNGRVNLSPKGLDTLRIFSDTCIAWLDLVGSENETAAHIAENGRLTLMFCSFEKKPLIMRLYGTGKVVRPQDADWNDLHGHFPSFPGERQIILLHIESLMTSCGFGVPVFEYKGERTKLLDYAIKKGADGMLEYMRKKNQHSMDGLPTYLFEDPKV